MKMKTTTLKSKPGAGSQQPAGRRRRDASRSALLVLLASGFWLLASATSPASAAPSQEDVFKSIQQNVGKRSDDSSRGLAVVMGGAGALILALLIGSKVRGRQSRPKVVDHPRKLLREVMKTVPLKKKELKQLKLLAEESRQDGATGEPVESPLTLILCPSVLARTLKDRPAKVDRAVVAGLVRKMGVGK